VSDANPENQLPEQPPLVEPHRSERYRPRDTQPLGGLPDQGEPGSQAVLSRLAGRRALAALGVFSIALLVLAALGAIWLLSPGPDTTPELTPPASLGELATEFPELATILQDSTLDSVYKDFLLVYEQQGPEAALEMAQARGLLNANNELRLTLELDTNDSSLLISELEASGIKVTAASENLVDIAIPVELLEQALNSGDPAFLFQNITSLGQIMRVRLPRTGLQDAGSTQGEGVEIIGAPIWQQAGFSGSGIKIGVLDMGFNKYRSLLGDELPQQVTARSFIAGVEIDDSSTEHGTAVAEIIHDIAPEAELVFAAYETDAEMGQAVEWLISQQVQIISHSAGSLYGPMDGSGYEAGLVDDAFARGILWVNSSGNSGDTHYRAVFSDTDGDGFHEFRSGDERLDLIADERVTLVLNWDAWDIGDQDYDLYVFDDQGVKIASSENFQGGRGDEAAEYITYAFPDSGPYYVAFYASNITRPAVFDFYVYNAEIEYYNQGDSITTPADAAGALTVGATYWRDDELEVYSSRGPTRDGRLKPEISAPTGVSSAAYGEYFYGTSSSAPHVAGAAALVWQAQPQFTAAQVRDFLLSRAIDLGEAGPDNAYGYGRLSLGDPSIALQPTPVATEAALIATATSSQPTAPPGPTPLPTITAAPTVVPTSAVNPIATPPPATLSASLLLFPLLTCVVLPGMLGLGGLGLLGGVIYLNSNRRTPAKPARPAVRPSPPDRLAAPAMQPYSHLPPEQPPVHHPAPVLGGLSCPRCASPCRPQARFCPECGLQLSGAGPASSPISAQNPPRPIFCIHCGQAMRTGSRFCPRCGKPRQAKPGEQS
jgi:subtilisin family serine protease